MRIAISLLATGAVTAALGGMFAFCRAEEADSPAESPDEAVLVEVEPSPEVGAASSPPIPISKRTWQADPRQEKPSLLVQDLAAIRERVGSAIPEHWDGLAGETEGDRDALFAQSVQALEARNPTSEAPGVAVPSLPAEVDIPPRDPGAVSPPELATSDVDFDVEFPPNGVGSEFEAPYLPPTPSVAPCDSPESWRELSRLLLATTRDLERMAHVLEEERRYEDADRLRALAASVRRENRRIATDAVTRDSAGHAVRGGEN